MLEAAAKPKRLYRSARAVAGEGGYVLALDGRPARTPGRAALALPTAELGEAVAAEWDAQGETVDPATMPLTRLANSAIDGVARELEAVRRDIGRYASSDLVVYRAGEPERLVAEQSAAWDPVVDWARAELGARFVLRQGLTYVEQPPESVAAVQARLQEERSPFRLAALHVMTTLTGSVLLALMQAGGGIEARAAWAAAHVDELYQEGLWAADPEALARRAARERDFMAAVRMLALTPSRP